jgi:hypothetical protein
MVRIGTDKGESVEEYDPDISSLLHGVSVIYGKTGSGKSTVVKHLMYILKQAIEVCFVVSPSEPSNSNYSDMIDSPMIHYSVAGGDLLKNILSWQEMRSSLYKKTTDNIILKSLYNKIPNQDVDAKILKITSRMNSVVSVISNNKVQEEKVKSDFGELITKIYKLYLTDNKHLLKQKTIYDSLTKAERYVVEYIDINPNLLLILDDCAAELKPFFNKETFRTIFYNCRHSFITVILCCQDDTDLPTNLRKNAKLTIFTDPIVAASNFERTSNKYPKYTQDKIRDASVSIFKDHRKLVYIGDDKKNNNIYHFTAVVYPVFKFGTDVLHTLCKKLSEGVDAVNVNNPFYKNFKL